MGVIMSKDFEKRLEALQDENTHLQVQVTQLQYENDGMKSALEYMKQENDFMTGMLKKVLMDNQAYADYLAGGAEHTCEHAEEGCGGVQFVSGLGNGFGASSGADCRTCVGAGTGAKIAGMKFQLGTQGLWMGQSLETRKMDWEQWTRMNSK